MRSPIVGFEASLNRPPMAAVRPQVATIAGLGLLCPAAVLPLELDCEATEYLKPNGLHCLLEFTIVGQSLRIKNSIVS